MAGSGKHGKSRARLPESGQPAPIGSQLLTGNLLGVFPFLLLEQQSKAGFWKPADAAQCHNQKKAYEYYEQ
jgi:hypothetical protein